jgi:hypothetical protein
MDFDFKRLTECDEPFFGIMLGKAAYPLGRVFLPVMFGCSEHGLICHLFELILVIHANTSNGTNHIV